jgi:hypothetical protein
MESVMTTKNLWFVFLVAIASFSLALGSCSNSDDDNGDDGGITDPPLESAATCEGCHTNESMLKATVEDEGPPPESEGEG